MADVHIAFTAFYYQSVSGNVFQKSSASINDVLGGSVVSVFLPDASNVNTLDSPSVKLYLER